MTKKERNPFPDPGSKSSQDYHRFRGQVRISQDPPAAWAYYDPRDDRGSHGVKKRPGWAERWHREGRWSYLENSPLEKPPFSSLLRPIPSVLPSFLLLPPLSASSSLRRSRGDSLESLNPLRWQSCDRGTTRWSCISLQQLRWSRVYRRRNQADRSGRNGAWTRWLISIITFWMSFLRFWCV